MASELAADWCQNSYLEVFVIHQTVWCLSQPSLPQQQAGLQKSSCRAGRMGLRPALTGCSAVGSRRCRGDDARTVKPHWPQCACKHRGVFTRSFIAAEQRCRRCQWCRARCQQSRLQLAAGSMIRMLKIMRSTCTCTNVE